MTPLDAFLQFLLPAVLVGLGLLAASFLPPREPAGRPEEPRPAPGLLGRIAPPALFGLAFWAGDAALNQWHPLWPRDGTNRYLAIALAAACAGVAHALVRSRALTPGLRLALGAAITLAILAPLDERYVPRPLLVTLALLAPLWLAGAGAALDRAHERLPRFGVPGALLATATFAAPGLFESGYAGGARFLGTLAAIAGGAFVAAMLPTRSRALPDGAHTVWLSLLLAVLLVTYGYNDVPVWPALPIMALAPLGALAGLLPRPAWARAVVAIFAAALIAGGATAAAVIGAPDQSDDPYYGG